VIRRVLLVGSSLVLLALFIGNSAARPAGADAGTLTPTLVWERDFPGVTFLESSPLAVTLATPAVMVGGEDGGLYALDIANGTPEPGWPQHLPYPIESSPAALETASGGSLIAVGSGKGQSTVARFCSGGSADAFRSDGTHLWSQTGTDPDCNSEPFAAGPTIGDVNSDGDVDVFFPSLGERCYIDSLADGALDAPYPCADSVKGSAALVQSSPGAVDLVFGGDATGGSTPGSFNGGRIRRITGAGQTLWDYHLDEQVRGSVAVGDVDGTRQESVISGAGDFWLQHGGATGSTRIFKLDLAGNLVCSRDLGGVTLGSPALADVAGTGHAYIVIGTAEGPNPGKVWVLDGACNPIPGWAGRDSGGGVVIGGITTADFNGDGHQDLLVPTGGGVFVYDGATGAKMFGLDEGQVGFQNSPLVTDDGGGALGMTVAGTRPNGTGVVQHWQARAPAGGGTATLGAIGWPTFHHDARRTGNLVPPSAVQDLCANAGNQGYWFVANDGGVFSFCGARFHGSGAGVTSASVVGMAPSATGGGYWLASADGGVLAFGDAPFEGSASAGGIQLARPVVGMGRTPSGRGYFLVASDGGIFAFGDAVFLGSTGAIRLNQPIVGMAVTPSGHGYWLVAADGGIFAFGDAMFLGSTGAIKLNRPIVGMARTPSGGGYYLVASDGGIFAFGDAVFYGSTGAIRLNQPIVGMAVTPSGHGYWLVAADGGIFAFGDARFLGSTGAIRLNRPIVSMAVPGGP